MRITRREVYSIIIVMTLAFAIMLSLPFPAFSFRPHRVSADRGASAEFVLLTEEERVEALKAAKTTWQYDSSESRGMRIRLPLGELPEEEQRSLLGDGDMPCGTIPFKPVVSRLPAWQPSFKAPAPIRLGAEIEEAKKKPFSREELLKL